MVGRESNGRRHMAIMRKQSPWHLRGVAGRVIDNPILNSPFAEPSRHWEFDKNGIPAGTPARGLRRSEFVAPVPPPKHKVKALASFDWRTNAAVCTAPRAAPSRRRNRERSP